MNQWTRQAQLCESTIGIWTHAIKCHWFICMLTSIIFFVTAGITNGVEILSIELEQRDFKSKFYWSDEHWVGSIIFGIQEVSANHSWLIRWKQQKCHVVFHRWREEEMSELVGSISDPKAKHVKRVQWCIHRNFFDIFDIFDY